MGAILKARRAADARLTLHWNGLSREARVAGIALAAWADEHARPIEPGDCIRFAKFFGARREVVLALGGWVYAAHRTRSGTTYVNIRASATNAGPGSVDPDDAEVAHALAVFGSAHEVNAARIQFRRKGAGD